MNDMNEAAIEQAARLLCAARMARTPVGALPAGCAPGDTAAGYAVQAVLHRHFAAAGLGTLGGYKIGCTTPVMQEFLGIDTPSAGGVLERAAHRGEATLRHEDYVRVGFEGEVAVLLGADLGDSTTHDRHSVAGAVQACMAAIEIVDERYEDYRSLGAPTLVADDFFQAGCVLGDPVASWQSIDLAAARGWLRVDGDVVDEGQGRAIMGHPFDALAWLANLLASQGRSLRAGQFVLLGSVVRTRWLEGQHRVSFELQGLGSASAQLL